MDYALQILKDELRLIRKVISQSDWSEYKEALKVREQKCKELERAIKLIENANK